MSFENSLNNRFRIYFPKNFIYDNIRSKYKNIMENLDFSFESLEDYINSTIIGTTMPGLSDPGTEEQYNRDGITRKYKSSAVVDNLIDKNFSITFKLTDGFLNWMILYDNMIAHLNHDNNKLYLPNIHLQLLDFDKNILCEFVYMETNFSKIDPLELSYSSNTPSMNTFTIEFFYNVLNINEYIKQ
jgi:hypothetical protein